MQAKIKVRATGIPFEDSNTKILVELPIASLYALEGHRRVDGSQSYQFFGECQLWSLEQGSP